MLANGFQKQISAQTFPAVKDELLIKLQQLLIGARTLQNGNSRNSKEEEENFNMKESLREKMNGRPSPTLTDRQWQQEFQFRKLQIKPYGPNHTRMGGHYSRESYRREDDTYDGLTNYQQYCRTINDMLSVIRSGKIDFCFFTYQIMDLLRFHYDDLCTKYIDGYWMVWLDD